MKTTEVLALLTHVLNAMNPAEAEEYLRAGESLKGLTHGKNYSLTVNATMMEALNEVIRVLTYDVVVSEQRKNGRATQAAACKRILKRLAKNAALSERIGCRAGTVNGSQVFTDGFMVVALNNPLQGIETASEQDTPQAVRSVYNVRSASPTDKPLDLPSRAEIVTYIATHKPAKKGRHYSEPVMYDFGEGLPLVNAEFLLDLMDALPELVVYYDAKHPTAPLYGVSPAGFGVLCGMRRTPAKKAA